MTADPHFSPPFDPDSKSLVKKYLTPYIFKTLKPLATDSGFTIEKAIASGLAHSDSHIGLYAGDAQSYQTFALIFDPIIREYHQFKSSQRHQHDWTDIDLPCLDPEKKYILSSRIRVARNLEGFNFPCHINPDERKRLENKIIETLACLKGGFKGQYVSLKTSGEKRLKPLEKKGLLFKKGDRFQEAAGINRDFPQSRGVYFSADTSFRIWKKPAGTAQGVCTRSAAVVLTAAQADITLCVCPDVRVIYAVPTPCTDPAWQIRPDDECFFSER
jgi:hypothetical protein